PLPIARQRKTSCVLFSSRGELHCPFLPPSPLYPASRLILANSVTSAPSVHVSKGFQKSCIPLVARKWTDCNSLSDGRKSLFAYDQVVLVPDLWRGNVCSVDMVFAATIGFRFKPS